MLFEFIVGFVVFMTLFETYLDLRQRGRLFRTQVPSLLQKYIAAEKFEKSQRYSLAKNTFGFVVTFFDLVHSLLSLYFFADVWRFSKRFAHMLHLPYANAELTVSLLFVSLLVLESTLYHIPFSIYSHFVIEERFGFNKLTAKLFVTDLLKTLGLSALIGLPIVAAVVETVRAGGPNFWIYVWLLLFAFSLLMLTVYPIWIAPLFNKFTPLDAGELRDAIFRLAERLQFPLTKLYVMDASTRSAHSNAYFYGFFKNKRIVLFDTLLKQVTQDGVVAILAHELGHWKRSHTLKNLVLVQLHLGTFLYVFSHGLHSAPLYRSFGFDDQPIIIGLALFSFLYSPVENAIVFLMNIISRHFEYQADEFATRLGYDLSEPLARIHEENLSQMDPDPLYSTYHYSHPSLIERLRRIAELKKA